MASRLFTTFVAALVAARASAHAGVVGAPAAALVFAARSPRAAALVAALALAIGVRGRAAARLTTGLVAVLRRGPAVALRGFRVTSGLFVVACRGAARGLAVVVRRALVVKRGVRMVVRGAASRTPGIPGIPVVRAPALVAGAPALVAGAPALARVFAASLRVRPCEFSISVLRHRSLLG